MSPPRCRARPRHWRSTASDSAATAARSPCRGTGSLCVAPTTAEAEADRDAYLAGRGHGVGEPARGAQGHDRRHDRGGRSRHRRGAVRRSGRPSASTASRCRCRRTPTCRSGSSCSDGRSPHWYRTTNRWATRPIVLHACASGADVITRARRRTGGHRVDDEMSGEESWRVGLDVLVQHLPLGVFITTARGKVVYVSDRCAQMIGAERDPSGGWAWVERIHDEDRDRVVAAWTDSLGGGPSTRATGWCATAEPLRWVHVHADPVVGDGTVRGRHRHGRGHHRPARAPSEVGRPAAHAGRGPDQLLGPGRGGRPERAPDVHQPSGEAHPGPRPAVLARPRRVRAAAPRRHRTRRRGDGHERRHGTGGQGGARAPGAPRRRRSGERSRSSPTTWSTSSTSAGWSSPPATSRSAWRAQASADQARDRFEQAFDRAPIGMALIANDGRAGPRPTRRSPTWSGARSRT